MEKWKYICRAYISHLQNVTRVDDSPYLNSTFKCLSFNLTQFCIVGFPGWVCKKTFPTKFCIITTVEETFCPWKTLTFNFNLLYIFLAVFFVILSSSFKLLSLKQDKAWKILVFLLHPFKINNNNYIFCCRDAMF